MPTIEERLQAIEQEHAQLKKTIELQTIAIGALVNKATLEKLNEKYDKIFEALIAHDRLTNERLGDIQTQLIEQDGKIVGLQTEMRQHFNEQDSKVAELDSKVTGLQTTQTEHTTLLTQILARLPDKPNTQETK
ncbi:MAG: hypothetical protein JO011_06705 [Ktedonobacteraceae bacterium]|nr:hypothetical protein [Ktedonobacteraceae bacterium]